ncbi:MAG: TIM barrel protein [Desulfobacterales bacterium]|nr:TIM barrel protein [Desulfobacterales bacterium]
MSPMPRGFRLGTTSFIYPGMILPNVEKLGPHFDEIELLVFESRPYQGMSVLPTREEVNTLAALAGDMDLTYNVHMPVDVSLTAPREQALAADTLARVMELMAPLAPTTHTVHLAMGRELAGRLRRGFHGLSREQREEAIGNVDGVLSGPLAHELKCWHEQALCGLDQLQKLGLPLGQLTIETLDYPPELLAPMLDAFPVGLCVDAGHHFKYGFDLDATFQRWGGRVPLVHLHGVEPRDEKVKDHIGLDRMAPGELSRKLKPLEGFGGSVSLEVFSLAHLNGCLGALTPCFQGIPSQLGA